MNVESLKQTLVEIERVTNEEWMRSLDERKKKELEFHDQDRDPGRKKELKESAPDQYEKFYGNRKYYGAAGLSKQYMNDWIAANAKGRIFLDYACGSGKYAIKAAKAGAALAIGLDISPLSIDLAKLHAQEERVSGNSYFVQADAENTRFPSGSIDVIFCSGMLHHLDLSYAFPELRRILAPGGKILCIEALDYNPAIKLYRNLTPEMRTEWEKNHILSLKDVEFAKRFFDLGAIRYWHLASLLAPFAKPLLPFLNWLDEAVLMRVPGVQQMAWIFTFELLKKERDER